MLIEVYREDNEIWVTVRDDIIKGEVFKEAREIDGVESAGWYSADIFKLIVGDQHAAAGFRDNLFYRLKKTAINKGLKGLFDTVVQAQVFHPVLERWDEEDQEQARQQQPQKQPQQYLRSRQWAQQHQAQGGCRCTIL